MATRVLARSLFGFAVVVLAGCSSGYRPANDPHIAIVTERGTLAFYKNGRHYDWGFAGEGAIAVVKGNAHAERRARSAHKVIAAGMVIQMVGLGSMIAGTTVLTAYDPATAFERNLGGGLVIGGGVVYIAGLILSATGMPGIYDAINVYNDESYRAGGDRSLDAYRRRRPARED